MLMQFMKSKSITFVLLVTLVMSWTGIAFAFVPATTNVHHLTIQMKTMQEHSSMHKGDTSEHCLTQVKASQKHVMQHDMQSTNAHCEQSTVSDSDTQSSHQLCKDCSIGQCQSSICSVNLLESNTLSLSTFNSKNIFNSVYGIFHSSDFKQDILRPPQA